MAQGVSEREVAAKLRHQAEAKERSPGTAVRNFQRNAERDVDDEKKDRAGNHRETQKDQRAGGHAHALGSQHIHGETRGCCQGHRVAPAELEMLSQIAGNDDHTSGDR